MAGNLTQFNPFRELAMGDPFRNMERMMSNFRMRSLFDEMTDSRIRMDVEEGDTQFVVKAEIPGVKKEDIAIDISGNEISVSAETRRETEEKSAGNVLHSERYYGKFYRSFTLNHEVDESQSQASYQDGILTLTLPKKPGAASRKLMVS